MIDDFQGMNTTAALTAKDAAQFDALLEELGVQQNNKKRIEPTHTVKYLGMWICTIRGIVFMDKEKVQKDKNTLNNYIKQK